MQHESFLAHRSQDQSLDCSAAQPRVSLKEWIQHDPVAQQLATTQAGRRTQERRLTLDRNAPPPLGAIIIEDETESCPPFMERSSSTVTNCSSGTETNNETSAETSASTLVENSPQAILSAFTKQLYPDADIEAEKSLSSINLEATDVIYLTCDDPEYNEYRVVTFVTRAVDFSEVWAKKGGERTPVEHYTPAGDSEWYGLEYANPPHPLLATRGHSLDDATFKAARGLEILITTPVRHPATPADGNIRPISFMDDLVSIGNHFYL